MLRGVVTCDKSLIGITGLLLGVSATIGLCVFAGYKIALCVLLMMMADSISKA